MTTAALTLVPAWRLGALLQEARRADDRSLEQVAERSDRFDAQALTDLERGDRLLTDADVAHIVAIYGVDPDELLPGRTDLVVDLDRSRLATAGQTQALAGGSPTADEVLAAYLALVYTLRSTDPGERIPLRDADLDVLALALALATTDVEQRLVGLMVRPTADVTVRSRLLRARVLVPAAGILVAVTVAGALVISARTPRDTPPAPTTTPAPPAAVQIPPVVQGDGLTSDQVPAGAVGLGEAQVATRDGSGNLVQGPRTDDASTSSTTTP